MSARSSLFILSLVFISNRTHLTPMKTGIHPTYHKITTITCACGAVLNTGSTVATSTIEICSQCHPFYTGKKKFLDAGGRVDRFKKMAERSAAKATALQPKKTRVSKQEVKTEGK